jgi:hypothetical protein
MGFPMRYPRFLVVLFVVLGLAVLSSAPVAATDGDTLPDALEEIDAMALRAHEASFGAEVARWDGLIDAISRSTRLEPGEAEQLVVAIADLVLAITEAGERAGVLATPDAADLLDTMYTLAASTDLGTDEAVAEADRLTERAIEATVRMREAERRAMEVLADAAVSVDSDPVERWRPLVDEYFAPELVGEALAIIDCESNGDPDVRNRRSGAAGLFQFIRGTWVHASAQAGFAGASPYEPEANIAAAAWLAGYSLDHGDAAWSHWTCRP